MKTQGKVASLLCLIVLFIKKATGRMTQRKRSWDNLRSYALARWE